MDAGSIPASSINIITMDKLILFTSTYKGFLIKLFFVCFFIGYLFGSIPIAYLYSKAHGVNIFEFGSGNPGSTNVGRALGKRHGRIVFFLDILKIVLPVLIITLLFFHMYNNKLFNFANFKSDIDNRSIIKLYANYIAIYTGLGGVIGHNYPIFMHFKGGKGISCTMGAMFSLSPIYSFALYLTYKLVTKITKYVSVGSLTALTALLISSIIFSISNIFPFNYYNNIPYGILLIPGIFIMWILGIIRHRKNIERLFNGTENKTE